MRRSEKAITDQAELERIIRSGRICHLTLADEPAPYIVPLNYGFSEGALYFHSAPEGRKIELMRRNPIVGFAISLDLGVVEGEKACNWTARYRSVLGHGRIEFIEGLAEKRTALDLIMAQYAEGEFSYPEASVRRTVIYRLVIEQLSGKQSRI